MREKIVGDDLVMDWAIIDGGSDDDDYDNDGDSDGEGLINQIGDICDHDDSCDVILSAAASVNYENEKDVNSAGNGHVVAPQQPLANPEQQQQQQQTSNGIQVDHIKPSDTLSVGSSVNYYVPSDSDVDDDMQDVLAGALAPSKIPQ